MQNLSVVVDFSQAKGNDMVTANLSWIAPTKPYGKICRYVIVISTPKIETLYSGTVDAKVRNILTYTISDTVIITLHSKSINNAIYGYLFLFCPGHCLC